MKCPFCDVDIIRKHKIYETGTEHVIYNIRPANKGQCLVVPKRHVKRIRELSEEEAGSMLLTMKHVSEKLDSYLCPDGFNYGLNEGDCAGQTIEHLHFHIMPRYKGDSLPEYHLFHRDPSIKKDLGPAEIEASVKEFRKVFQGFSPD